MYNDSATTTSLPVCFYNELNNVAHAKKENFDNVESDLLLVIDIIPS